ncbi:MAG: hypothetical protein GX946_04475 [Oligosphaeraceae bacterium]|nr:hypothetical protein [Oligosphaeraceae bacterium]
MKKIHLFRTALLGGLFVLLAITSLMLYFRPARSNVHYEDCDDEHVVPYLGQHNVSTVPKEGNLEGRPYFLAAKEMLRRRRVSTDHSIYTVAAASRSFFDEPHHRQRFTGKIGKRRKGVTRAKPLPLSKGIAVPISSSGRPMEICTDPNECPFVLWRELHMGKDNRMSINLMLINQGYLGGMKPIIVSQIIPEGWVPCLTYPEMQAYESEKREIKWLISDASLEYGFPLQVVLIPTMNAEKLPLPEEMTQMRCIMDNGKLGRFACQEM